MAEKYILLVIVCLTYLELSIGACASEKRYTQCKSCSNGRNEKLLYPQSHNINEGYQSNHNTVRETVVSSQIHHENARAFDSSSISNSASNAFNPLNIYYPSTNTMGAPSNIDRDSSGYLRNIRSAVTNQQTGRAGDLTDSRQHDLYLRVRRNVNDDIASTTINSLTDSDEVSKWQYLFSSIRPEKNFDDAKKQEKDEESPRRSRTTDDFDDSIDEDISTSSEEMSFSIQYLNRIMQKLPQFLQRLKILQTLVSCPFCYEDNVDADSLNRYSTELDTDSDDYFNDMKMTGPSEGSNQEASTKDDRTERTSTQELAKMPIKRENEKIAPNSPGVSSAIQHHAITLPRL